MNKKFILIPVISILLLTFAFIINNNNEPKLVCDAKQSRLAEDFAVKCMNAKYSLEECFKQARATHCQYKIIQPSKDNKKYSKDY